VDRLQSRDAAVCGLSHVVHHGVVVEVDAGVLGRADELSPVLPPVDHRQFARDGDLQDGVFARDLEAAVVDVRVGERRLEPGLRDRRRKLVCALQRVATGDVAGLLGVFSLDDHDVEPLVRDRRGSVTAGGPRAHHDDVVLVDAHYRVM